MEGVPGNRAGGTESGSQVDQAAEQAKQQGQRFAQQASELADRGNEQIKSQLANQKHQAAQRMTPVQAALRETGQQLRNQGQGPVAEYATRQLSRSSGSPGTCARTTWTSSWTRRAASPAADRRSSWAALRPWGF